MKNRLNFLPLLSFSLLLILNSCTRDQVKPSLQENQIEIPNSLVGKSYSGFEKNKLFKQANSQDIDRIKSGIESNQFDFSDILDMEGNEAFLDYENAISHEVTDLGNEVVIVELSFEEQNSSTNYGVSFVKVDNKIFPSMIIETKHLTEDINEANYYSFGGKLSLSAQIDYQSNTVEFSENGVSTNSDCDDSYGQAVADCISSAYTDNGWESVFLWVASAFEPPVAAMVAGACAIDMYPINGECYNSF